MMVNRISKEEGHSTFGPIWRIFHDPLFLSCCPWNIDPMPDFVSKSTSFYFQVFESKRTLPTIAYDKKY